MSATSYVATIKLPPSYTIMPLSNWTSFTLTALPTGSLVWICATGIYHGALGFVISASINLVYECALVAVIPKIKYPDICHPTEDEHHGAPTKQLTKIRFHTDHPNSPPKKCTKIKSPNHPNLFDLKCLLICDPHNKGSSSSMSILPYTKMSFLRLNVHILMQMEWSTNCIWMTSHIMFASVKWTIQSPTSQVLTLNWMSSKKPLLSITIVGTFIILAPASYLFLNTSHSHSIIYIKSMKGCHSWRLV